MCASGGKKCSFSGKFGVLCFVEIPVLRFALLLYYRRYVRPCYSFLLAIGEFEIELALIPSLQTKRLRKKLATLALLMFQLVF